ncbi:MAG TPA: hypothetical protein VFC92_01205 [Bacteroidales bacterium]|nr:hypothetical protein [Bacteroidales bacterium]
MGLFETFHCQNILSTKKIGGKNKPQKPENRRTARQGLERHPDAAAADVFVGGQRLTTEAPVPPTKTQPVQDGYSGKPIWPPK